MAENKEQCIVCGRTSKEIPLIEFNFRGRYYWVCSADLPVLIHHPEQLAGKLPGAELIHTPNHGE